MASSSDNSIINTALAAAESGMLQHLGYLSELLQFYYSAQSLGEKMNLHANPSLFKTQEKIMVPGGGIAPPGPKPGGF